MAASVTQNLWNEIQTAPETVQAEVLDFLMFIKARRGSSASSLSFSKPIRKSPGVCGGEACLGDTRIAVWMLEEARRAGVSDAELLQDYPSLNARDLAAVWTYVDSNPEEIDFVIAANHDA
jgi:uncharacterized protein (DUF433 family)